MRSLRPASAVAIGTLVVNVPVFLLLFGPGSVAIWLGRDDTLPWLIPLSFAAAWGWWSVLVPRWRLWAYERVPSTGALHDRAVAAGLLWPRGSFFERTEMKTLAQRERQEELESKFP